MEVHIPSLSYELNTMVCKYRQDEGYSQEEFAFLIGRSLEEVQQNEDLTSESSNDINHTNFYARILDKKLNDMFFRDSITEPTIKIIASKSTTKKSINYRGTATIGGKPTVLKPYSIPLSTAYGITEEDQDSVLTLLDSWLNDGYFRNGVTGYALYCDLLKKQADGIIVLPDSFRPILVARAVVTMCNRRKKPKLLPQRQLPKTPEKWLLYKEDV